MATYYVKNGGSDGATGLSDALAWATINKVQTTLTGDQSDNSVLFKRGSTWREQFSVGGSGTSGHQFTIGSYSTGAKPIITGADLITNFTVETTYWYFVLAADPKQVFYDGARLTKVATKVEATTGKWWWDSANTRVYMGDNPSGHTVEASVRDYCLWVRGKSYVTTDGLNADKARTHCVAVYDFSTVGSTYNTITNMDVSYSYRKGIHLYSGTGDRVIQHNTIGPGNEVHNSGGDGIAISDYSSDNLTTGNSVHNNCELEIEGSYSDHDFTAGIKFNLTDGLGANIVEKNYVYSNGVGRSGDRGCGIWFDGLVHGQICRYNLVQNNNWHGIQYELQHEGQCCYNICTGHAVKNYAAGIAIMGSSTSVEGNLVYGNVCYANLEGILIQGNYQVANTCLNNVLRNNICVGNTSRQLRACLGGENAGVEGSGNVYDHNCFGAQATGFISWGFSTYKDTYDAWETAYGGTTYSVEADPLLTNPGNGDFTLQAASPCIDAGVNLGATYDDALMPGSRWPNAVVTGNQNEHGRGWEIGAYIRSRINTALAVGGS